MVYLYSSNIPLWLAILADMESKQKGKNVDET